MSVNFKKLLWSDYYTGGPRTKISQFLRDHRDDGEAALEAAMEFAEDNGIMFDRDLVREMVGLQAEDTDWEESNWNSSGCTY